MTGVKEKFQVHRKDGSLLVGGNDPILVTLINALGLPEYCRGFTLHCYLDDIVTIEVKYFPKAADEMHFGTVAEIFKSWNLRKVPEGEEQAQPDLDEEEEEETFEERQRRIAEDRGGLTPKENCAE